MMGRRADTHAPAIQVDEADGALTVVEIRKARVRLAVILQAMGALLLLLFAVLPVAARAEVVLVSVLERGGGVPLRFEIDTAKATSSSSTTPAGDARSVIDAYVVRAGRLVRTSANTTIGTAVELLGQVQISEGDLVVVRQEHNSLSNPLRWLAALSGHPVQVSRITWFLVSSTGEVRSDVLLSRAGSSHWSVSLFEKGD